MYNIYDYVYLYIYICQDRHDERDKNILIDHTITITYSRVVRSKNSEPRKPLVKYQNHEWIR